MSEVSYESRRSQRGRPSAWSYFAKALATIGVWYIGGQLVLAGHTDWIIVVVLIGTFFIWSA